MSRSHPQSEKSQTDASVSPQAWSWPYWPVVPLYPYGQRRTLRREVLKDTIWTFDQLQGIFYVIVPVRMTVVKLEAGGLFVYAPVAPTPECIELVRELESQHGEVKHIILPTVSGIEHKAFAGPFARHFPNAQVFVSPHQWSFPLKLPLSWLGFPPKRTHRLPDQSSDTPFADEFDYRILGPLKVGLGPYEEVAFFHKRSRTLLAIDAVISIPEEPPAIVQLDPYPLLFHAKDNAFDIVEDSAANRRKGWQRISLFASYIQPSALDPVPLGQALRNARQAPDWSKKAYFGFFPFQWQKGWQQSFETLRGGGRLLVAPILQTLVFNRAPKATLDWADHVASWDFQRLISCHFHSPVETTPQDFRQAFAFLEPHPPQSYGLPSEDLALLRQLNQTLTKTRIARPAREKMDYAQN